MVALPWLVLGAIAFGQVQDLPLLLHDFLTWASHGRIEPLPHVPPAPLWHNAPASPRISMPYPHLHVHDTRTEDTSINVDNWDQSLSRRAVPSHGTWRSELLSLSFGLGLYRGYPVCKYLLVFPYLIYSLTTNWVTLRRLRAFFAESTTNFFKKPDSFVPSPTG